MTPVQPAPVDAGIWRGFREGYSLWDTRGAGRGTSTEAKHLASPWVYPSVHQGDVTGQTPGSRAKSTRQNPRIQVWAALGQKWLWLLATLFFYLPFSVGAPNLPCDKALIALITGQDQKYTCREYLYREHDIGGKPYHEVLVVEEFESDNGLVTRVLRREVRAGKAKRGEGTSGPMPKALEADVMAMRAWHLATAKELVGYGIEAYRKFGDWDPKFVDEIEALTEEYLNDSIYVSVREKKSDEVVGVMRYILAPYGVRGGELVPEGYFVDKYHGPATSFREPGEKDPLMSLPRPPRKISVETKLGMDLPHVAVAPTGSPLDVPSGVHVELGSWWLKDTVKGQRRADVWTELWLQLARVAFDTPDERLSTIAKSYYAGADKLHAGIYEPMGMEPIRTYGLNGKVFAFPTDSSVKPITTGGEGHGKATEWWPLFYDPAEIEQYTEKASEGKEHRFGNSNMSDRRQAIGDGKYEGGLEIENVDRLLQVWKEGNEKTSAFALRALMHMVYRRTIQDLRSHMPGIPQEQREAAQRGAEYLREPVERIAKAVFSKVTSTDKTDRMTVGYLAQGLLTIGASPSPFSRADIRDRILIPLLSDPEYQIRYMAWDTLHQFYSPEEAEGVSRGSRDHQAEIERLRKQLTQKGLSDEHIDSMVNAAGQFLFTARHTPDDYRFTDYPRLIAAINASEGTDPETMRLILRLEALSGPRPTIPPELAHTNRIRQIFSNAIARGGDRAELMQERLEGLAGKIEQKAKQLGGDKDPHARTNGLLGLDSFLSLADFTRTTLPREKILTDFFLKTMVDPDPSLRRLATYEIRRHFSLPEVQASLIGGQNQTELRQKALETLHAAGWNDDRIYTFVAGIRYALRDVPAPPALDMDSEIGLQDPPLQPLLGLVVDERPPSQPAAQALFSLAALPD